MGLTSYSKEQQVARTPKTAKQQCRVIGCSIQATPDSIYCNGHKNLINDIRHGDRHVNASSSLSNLAKSTYGKGKRRGYATKKNNPWKYQFDNTTAAFQRLRRAECAGETGHKDLVLCRSIKLLFHWDDGVHINGGHLIAAKNLSTCFLSENVWPQRALANLNMDDAKISKPYIDWYVSEFGEAAYDRLVMLSHQTIDRWPIEILKAMEHEYRLELHKCVIAKGLTIRTPLPALSKENKLKLREWRKKILTY